MFLSDPFPVVFVVIYWRRYLLKRKPIENKNETAKLKEINDDRDNSKWKQYRKCLL